MLKKIKSSFIKILGPKFIPYYMYRRDRKYMNRYLGEKEGRKQIQKADKVAIIFIATGKYINFFEKYYVTVMKNFLPLTNKTIFVFTEQIDYHSLKNKKNIVIVKTKKEKWPYSTLKRYGYILSLKNKLKGFSHVIYIDADMAVNEKIKEENFFSHDKPLFGVRHPDFVKEKRMGRFEFNPKSKACVSRDEDLSTYWQGCFWGGRKKDILAMIDKLYKDTNYDLKKGLIPVCWDESYLNKYFVKNKKKVFTYPPSYAYPDSRPISKQFKKKIVHFDNKDKTFQV